MDLNISWIRTNASYILLLLVIISAIFGLWLRFLPMEFVSDGPVQKLVFMDTWYSMRQIEQISANYPGYALFDPMTAFPTGKDIDWGPLFPFLCATVCVLFGAVTRPDNMIIASFIPPLLFLFLIPVVWYLGRMIGGEKAGWIAAIVLPVLSGELLYRSFYGYLDHHITETLFSTLFIALIIALILTIHKEKSGLYTNRSILLALSSGVAYFLGIMNMPTMVLFIGICALIFLIHAVMVRDTNHLLSLFLHSGLFFGIFSLLFIFLGMSHEGISINQYGLAQLLVALILPLEAGILTLFCHFLAQKPIYYYLSAVAGSVILGYAVMATMVSVISQQVINSFQFFFFFSYAESYINEMQMWDPVRAWYSFNITLFLALLGIVICIIRLIRSYKPAVMAALVWGIVILFATIMHLRYEYYVSVVIVLFSAVTLSSLYEKIAESEKPVSRTKKGVGSSEQVLPFRAIGIVGILILFIAVFSTQTVMIVTEKQIGQISISDDWIDTLAWLSNNTPDSGVDYDAIYKKTDFSYPKNSYGILSWWDYGHWITFLTKRIPISSPFQDNVPPVAGFLSSQSEGEADKYAKKVGARYIITDYATVTSKYAALPLWAHGKDNISMYQETYYQQTPGAARYDPVLILKQPYFNSTASKLHIFDGSYYPGSGGNVFTTEKMPMNGGAFSVITSATEISSDEAENLPRSEQRFAGSIQFSKPITDITSLGHYRLIYESPTTVAADDILQIKDVKVFERVKGFTISGNGTVELPITTNQGRNFTWRQQSTNGRFTLPYSTQNNPYDVRSTGQYRIIESGKTIEVSEEQVK